MPKPFKNKVKTNSCKPQTGIGAQVQTKFSEGLKLHRLGQVEEARVLYQEVLNIQPDHFDALHLSGVLASQTMEYGLAIELIRKAVGIKPDFPSAYYNLAKAFQELGQLDDAQKSYEQAISLKPDFSEAYNNLGNVIRNRKQFGDALRYFEKAIALRPDYAEAFYNRGIALQELEQFDAAIESYDHAILFRPGDAETHYNRGNAFRDTNRLVEAIQSYETAIAIKPNAANAHYNLSLAMLLSGEFKRGWEEYEWRWKEGSFPSPFRNFSEPLWLGQDSLEARRILLHAEQGLGDALQFCRFAKSVSDLGAEVILEVQKPLLDLLANIEGVADIVAQGSQLPSFDYHCPLLSLPLALSTTIESIPVPMPYLFSEPQNVDVWRAKLGERSLPRIGLAWSGSAEHINDKNRSIPLAEFVACLPERFQYISLQKEVRDSDLVALGAHREILHFEDELNDFTDTAALCELVDLVISVDTSVAHLAAAMGKPVLLLLPYSPDWRWLLDRTDSPWYPTVKLLRKQQGQDWLVVLQRVAADLRQRFGA